MGSNSATNKQLFYNTTDEIAADLQSGAIKYGDWIDFQGQQKRINPPSAQPSAEVSPLQPQGPGLLERFGTVAKKAWKAGTTPLVKNEPFKAALGGMIPEGVANLYLQPSANTLRMATVFSKNLLSKRGETVDPQTIATDSKLFNELLLDPEINADTEDMISDPFNQAKMIPRPAGGPGVVYPIAKKILENPYVQAAGVAVPTLLGGLKGFAVGGPPGALGGAALGAGGALGAGAVFGAAEQAAPTGSWIPPNYSSGITGDVLRTLDLATRFAATGKVAHSVARGAGEIPGKFGKFVQDVVPGTKPTPDEVQAREMRKVKPLTVEQMLAKKAAVDAARPAPAVQPQGMAPGFPRQEPVMDQFQMPAGVIGVPPVRAPRASPPGVVLPPRGLNIPEVIPDLRAQGIPGVPNAPAGLFGNVVGGIKAPQVPIDNAAIVRRGMELRKAGVSPNELMQILRQEGYFDPSGREVPPEPFKLPPQPQPMPGVAMPGRAQSGGQFADPQALPQEGFLPPAEGYQPPAWNPSQPLSIQDIMNPPEKPAALPLGNLAQDIQARMEAENQIHPRPVKNVSGAREGVAPNILNVGNVPQNPLLEAKPPLSIMDSFKAPQQPLLEANPYDASGAIRAGAPIQLKLPPIQEPPAAAPEPAKLPPKAPKGGGKGKGKGKKPVILDLEPVKKPKTPPPPIGPGMLQEQPAPQNMIEQAASKRAAQKVAMDKVHAESDKKIAAKKAESEAYVKEQADKRASIDQLRKQLADENYINKRAEAEGEYPAEIRKQIQDQISEQLLKPKRSMKDIAKGKRGSTGEPDDMPDEDQQDWLPEGFASLGDHDSYSKRYEDAQVNFKERIKTQAADFTDWSKDKTTFKVDWTQIDALQTYEQAAIYKELLATATSPAQKESILKRAKNQFKLQSEAQLDVLAGIHEQEAMPDPLGRPREKQVRPASEDAWDKRVANVSKLVVQNEKPIVQTEIMKAVQDYNKSSTLDDALAELRKTYRRGDKGESQLEFEDVGVEVSKRRAKFKGKPIFTVDKVPSFKQLRDIANGKGDFLARDPYDVLLNAESFVDALDAVGVKSGPLHDFVKGLRQGDLIDRMEMIRLLGKDRYVKDPRMPEGYPEMYDGVQRSFARFADHAQKAMKDYAKYLTTEMKTIAPGESVPGVTFGGNFNPADIEVRQRLRKRAIGLLQTDNMTPEMSKEYQDIMRILGKPEKSVEGWEGQALRVRKMAARLPESERAAYIEAQKKRFLSDRAQRQAANRKGDLKLIDKSKQVIADLTRDIDDTTKDEPIGKMLAEMYEGPNGLYETGMSRTDLKNAWQIELDQATKNIDKIASVSERNKFILELDKKKIELENIERRIQQRAREKRMQERAETSSINESVSTAQRMVPKIKAILRRLADYTDKTTELTPEMQREIFRSYRKPAKARTVASIEKEYTEILKTYEDVLKTHSKKPLSLEELLKAQKAKDSKKLTLDDVLKPQEEAPDQMEWPFSQLRRGEKGAASWGGKVTPEVKAELKKLMADAELKGVPVSDLIKKIWGQHPQVVQALQRGVMTVRREMGKKDTLGRVLQDLKDSGLADQLQADTIVKIADETLGDVLKGERISFKKAEQFAADPSVVRLLSAVYQLDEKQLAGVGANVLSRMLGAVQKGKNNPGTVQAVELYLKMNRFAGRLLEMQKHISEADSQQLANKIGTILKDQNLTDSERMVYTMVRQSLPGMKRSKVRIVYDTLKEIAINNMLAAMITTERNIAGASALVNKVSDTFFTASVQVIPGANKLLRGREQRYVGEVLPLLVTLFKELPWTVKKGVISFFNPKDANLVASIDRRITSILASTDTRYGKRLRLAKEVKKLRAFKREIEQPLNENIARTSDEVFSGSLKSNLPDNVYGAMMGGPGKRLTLQDKAVYGILSKMETKATLLRQKLKAAPKLGDRMGILKEYLQSEMRGPQFKSKFNGLKTGLTEHDVTRIHLETLKYIFRQKMPKLGPINLELIARTPVIDMIFPFVKSGTNMTRNFAESHPVGSAVKGIGEIMQSSSIPEGEMSWTQRVKGIKVGKQDELNIGRTLSFSTAVAGIILMAKQMGITLHSRPTSPDERRTRQQAGLPEAYLEFRNGKTTDIANAAPMSFALETAAMLTDWEARRKLGDPLPERIKRYLAQNADMIASNTVFDTADSLASAMKEWKTESTSGEIGQPNDPNAWMRFLNRQVSGWVVGNDLREASRTGNWMSVYLRAAEGAAHANSNVAKAILAVGLLQAVHNTVSGAKGADRNIYRPRNVAEQVRADLPFGNKSDIPKTRNIFGDVAKRRAPVSPFRLGFYGGQTAPVDADTKKILKEFERIGFNPSILNANIGKAGMRMASTQIERVSELISKSEIKQELMDEINDPYYQDPSVNDAERIDILKKVLGSVRKEAKSDLNIIEDSARNLMKTEAGQKRLFRRLVGPNQKFDLNKLQQAVEDELY